MRVQRPLRMSVIQSSREKALFPNSAIRSYAPCSYQRLRLQEVRLAEYLLHRNQGTLIDGCDVCIGSLDHGHEASAGVRSTVSQCPENVSDLQVLQPQDIDPIKSLVNTSEQVKTDFEYQ